MEYEIVNLETRLVEGLLERVSNTDSDVGEKIGKLWVDFFKVKEFKKIENKMGNKAIALYTNYEKDFLGKYDFLTCMEVSKKSINLGSRKVAEIKKGKYAKFIVKGNMQTAVIEFWNKLWKMDLDRLYISDFEEYQENNGDMDNTEIHIYIGIK